MTTLYPDFYNRDVYGNSKPAVISSPLDIPDCILWMDADDVTTIQTTGALVDQWDDKSINGFQWVPNSGPETPTFVPNSTFNKGGINFNGAQCLITTGSGPTCNDPTYFVVLTVSTPISTARPIESVIGAKEPFQPDSGPMVISPPPAVGTAVVGIFQNLAVQELAYTTATLAAGTHYFGFRADGNSNSFISYNGVDQSLVFSGNSATQFSEFGSIGALPPVCGTPYNGHVNEIIFYDRYIDDLEIQRVYDYIRAKWAL